MSTTADSEPFAELRRRQHVLEGTIARYKAKIADCEGELAECLEKQRRFPPVYPILTLPNEITSEIFVHCLFSPDIITMPRYSSPDPRSAPMLLLHVCRAWRSIAATTPRLWVDLRLALDRLSPPLFEADNFDKFLANWLARAGTCPLSLNLSGFVGSEEHGRHLVATIFLRLSSHIEILEMLTDTKYYPRHSLSFPLLGELILGLPDTSDEDLINLQQNPIQTFSAASQLRELDLSGQAAPSHFAISWEMLTTFTCESLTSRECVAVLRLAPSLVKCSLGEVTYVIHTDLPNISHPNLESLEINGCETLYPFFTFPALRDLTIYCDMKSEDPLRFMSRSSSSLLRLAGADIPIQTLRNMSILTRLETSTSQDDNYVFELLDMLNRTKNPDFLPRLEMLEFTDCEPYVTMYLVQVLSSRRALTQGGAAKLQSFRQIWSNFAFDSFQINYTGYVALALEKLVKDGMEIYIGPLKRAQCWGF
ncbi:hypothetical protein K438DRAFT_2013278 [Mycena galopus ATCC 62051]|nr:hypothetical protein K438DRAFT_2013278 [Mycena galopus ATCC 62051]